MNKKKSFNLTQHHLSFSVLYFIKKKKCMKEQKLNISFVMAHLVAFKALHKAFMFLITAKNKIRNIKIVANLTFLSSSHSSWVWLFLSLCFHLTYPHAVQKFSFFHKSSSNLILIFNISFFLLLLCNIQKI